MQMIGFFTVLLTSFFTSDLVESQENVMKYVRVCACVRVRLLAVSLMTFKLEGGGGNIKCARDQRLDVATTSGLV